MRAALALAAFLLPSMPAVLAACRSRGAVSQLFVQHRRLIRPPRMDLSVAGPKQGIESVPTLQVDSQRNLAAGCHGPSSVAIDRGMSLSNRWRSQP